MTSAERIEAALRGARLAKVALELVGDKTDALALKLVCRELTVQVLELQEFAEGIVSPKGSPAR